MKIIKYDGMEMCIDLRNALLSKFGIHMSADDAMMNDGNEDEHRKNYEAARLIGGMAKW